MAMAEGVGKFRENKKLDFSSGTFLGVIFSFES